jgi:hypothetical protein
MSRSRHGQLGWDELQPWLELSVQLPVGPLLCVLNGPTRGRQWTCAAARADLRSTAAHAGVRRRFAPQGIDNAEIIETVHSRARYGPRASRLRLRVGVGRKHLTGPCHTP